MAAKKPTEAPAKPAAVAAEGSKRKPWIRRSPVDVVLQQIERQETRVADLQQELNKEKRELEKLNAARKVLEAT